VHAQRLEGPGRGAGARRLEPGRGRRHHDPRGGGFQVDVQREGTDDPALDGVRAAPGSGGRSKAPKGATVTIVVGPVQPVSDGSASPSSWAGGRASTRSPSLPAAPCSPRSIPSGTSGDGRDRPRRAVGDRGGAAELTSGNQRPGETLPVPAEAGSHGVPRGRGRRAPDPARPVRRGRDRPGPARAGRRPVRRRRRRRERGQHGQGPREGGAPRTRDPDDAERDGLARATRSTTPSTTRSS
jgi:hypothetical protein